METKKKIDTIQPKYAGESNNNFTTSAKLQTVERRFFESEQIKKSSAVVPTYEPKTFFEQFYLYKSGATNRLYVNIDNTWKYVTLT